MLDAEERLTRLEELNFFQEEQLKELNAALTAQQGQLDRLEQQLSDALAMIRLLRDKSADQPGKRAAPAFHARALLRIAMNSIFVREQPRFADPAVAFLQRAWGNEHNKTMYDDCVRHCLDSPSSLPQWYLLLDRETPAGCAGLIPNDFISRMDLRPWICSLYVAPCCRGREHGRLLLEKTKADARGLGFRQVYLCTDLAGYYERYGFTALGRERHPWGDSSRIYGAAL